MRYSVLAVLTVSLLSTSALAQLTPAPSSGASIPSGTHTLSMTPPQSPTGITPPPPGGPGVPNVDRMFDEVDTNHDGMISKQEFLAKAAQHYDEMDLNHDGQLTREEARASFEHHMHPGGPGGQGIPPQPAPMSAPNSPTGLSAPSGSSALPMSQPSTGSGLTPAPGNMPAAQPTMVIPGSPAADH